MHYSRCRSVFSTVWCPLALCDFISICDLEHSQSSQTQTRHPTALFIALGGFISGNSLAIGAYASWLLSPNRIMRNHAESCEIIADHANHAPDSAWKCLKVPDFAWKCLIVPDSALWEGWKCLMARCLRTKKHKLVFNERKQHKHKRFGPGFLPTFLTLPPRGQVKKLLRHRKTHLLVWTSMVFSEDVHDPKGSRIK